VGRDQASLDGGGPQPFSWGHTYTRSGDRPSLAGVCPAGAAVRIGPQAGQVGTAVRADYRYGALAQFPP